MPISRAKTSWLQQPPESFDASGAFETCRVHRGKVLHLAEHLRRLQESLQTLGISARGQKRRESTLRRAAREIKDGFVRIAVQRTGRERMIIHQHPGISYPKGWLRQGISIKTVATRWPSELSGLAQVKHSERLSGILARAEAQDSPEVLRLGPHGYLTEGTVSNFFLVKNDVLMTPPLWLGILEGVTRARVIQAARRLKIPVEEIPMTRHDLFNADEAFLTNVLMGLLPIRQVDGRRIGEKIPGPITRRLTKAMMNES